MVVVTSTMSGEIPLYASVHVLYGTRFGFVARAEPYDRWVELRSIIQTSKKKLMSSSKSYLYGRPVTEWSTPPPLSSKAQTTLLHKEAPGILPNFVHVKLISFTAIPSSKAMISVVPVKVVELNHFL